MASERNSIGVDIDEAICKNAVANLRKKTDAVNEIIDKRIDRHISFISSLSDDKRKKCYINEKHHFPVKTRQEIQLCIRLRKKNKALPCGRRLRYTTALKNRFLRFEITPPPRQ